MMSFTYLKNSFVKKITKYRKEFLIGIILKEI